MSAKEMIRKFIRTLFKKKVEEEIKPFLPTSGGHNLCPTVEDCSVVTPLPRLCRKCTQPLPANRKVYCCITCKNTDKEGNWKKNLNNSLKEIPSCMINPGIVYDEPAKIAIHPLQQSKYTHPTAASNHRNRIKDLSKW